MTDTLRKLGARRDDTLVVPDPDLRTFARGAKVLSRAPKGQKAHGVVFRPRRRSELASDLRRFRSVIRENGFIWVVIPKRTALEALGVDVTFQNLLDTALRTDLVDNKTLTFSDQEYGVRFAVRRHLRRL